MRLIEQNSKRLVFTLAPEHHQISYGTCLVCSSLVMLGLIASVIGLLGQYYSALGFGALLSMTGGAMLAYELHRYHAARRLYVLDQHEQVFLIWGWQPFNYGWQPPTYTVWQAWSQPTQRRLPLKDVKLRGPISSQRSTPVTGQLTIIWELFLVANDISIKFQSDAPKQIVETKTLIETYLDNSPTKHHPKSVD